MRRLWISLSTLLVVGAIGVSIFFGATPIGKQIIVNWQNSLKKVDESTYEQRKKVEDTCRAMMAQYKADKANYYAYKEANQDSLALQCKIRVNQVVAEYNEYILKNSYVWENNIPSDIDYQLTPITE